MRSADEIVRSSQTGYGATLTSATIFLVLRDRHGSAAALGGPARFLGLLWAALVLKDAADPSELPFLR